MRTDDRRAAFALLEAENFVQDSATGAWLNREHRKHIVYEAFADKSLDWLRGILAQEVPEGEFWFYSHYPWEPSSFERLVAKVDPRGLEPIGKPYADKPIPGSGTSPAIGLALDGKQ